MFPCGIVRFNTNDVLLLLVAINSSTQTEISSDINVNINRYFDSLNIYELLIIFIIIDNINTVIKLVV